MHHLNLPGQTHYKKHRIYWLICDVLIKRPAARGQSDHSCGNLEQLIQQLGVESYRNDMTTTYMLNKVQVLPNVQDNFGAFLENKRISWATDQLWPNWQVTILSVVWRDRRFWAKFPIQRVQSLRMGYVGYWVKCLVRWGVQFE